MSTRDQIRNTIGKLLILFLVCTPVLVYKKNFWDTLPYSIVVHCCGGWRVQAPIGHNTAIWLLNPSPIWRALVIHSSNRLSEYNWNPTLSFLHWVTNLSQLVLPTSITSKVGKTSLLELENLHWKKKGGAIFMSSPQDGPHLGTVLVPLCKVVSFSAKKRLIMAPLPKVEPF